ncbi:organic hydroperoxide resistance protein [Mangrovimonas sp. AS39]|uniref:organic hydroperoxide resistance protein n=1 Tax=Mangrovimonas futianensis TaxID=2895523 RepID=UPI001E46A390|nr:organic hydroperoxide resistance protein [Mangrovimonas futianensis]MCF1193016.1 organic hydroperoxide resistance protein [Mangrovimonas futianensis]MCF1196707.1 organic hydroperoxide resistance protein [Mangrovimonas futianensis]
MKTIYTTAAKVTGGRNGHVKSDNGILDLEVRLPKAMGGESDNYPNPEMLFAAGYAACFDSALNLIISKKGVDAGTTTVNAHVSIGMVTNGGYALAVTLDINIPGVSMEEAKSLSEKAHEICPYSNATRNNIEVTLNTTNQ